MGSGHACAESREGFGDRDGHRLSPPRWGLASLSVALLLVVSLVLASAADAVTYQRPFKEELGPAAKLSFDRPEVLAVNGETGDVIVGSLGTEGLSRFHADGSDAPFTALGKNNNVIDGKEANGKPCASEPASCDQTPQNGVAVSAGGNSIATIAFDESGGPTDGDIYLVQDGYVDIFAEDGRYLGQIDEVRGEPLASIYGAAVDEDGAVYLASDRGGPIAKFVPTGAVLTNADYVGPLGELPPLQPNEGRILRGIAAGRGPTAGSVFLSEFDYTAGTNTYHVSQISLSTGKVEYQFAQEKAKTGMATSPATGNVLALDPDDYEVSEYEAATGSAPVKVSRFSAPTRYRRIEQIAVTPTDEVLTIGVFEGGVRVYGLPVVVPTVTTEAASGIGARTATLNGTVEPDGVEVTECFFEYGESANPEGEKKAPCEGAIPTDSEPHRVKAQIGELAPDGHRYFFRLKVVSTNGASEGGGESLTTAPTVSTETAAPIGSTTATLNGTVRPEGEPFTECFFEYGPSTSLQLEERAPCEPGPKGIEADFRAHLVRAAISSLAAGSSYRFRLVATDGAGTSTGEDQELHTHGAPEITDVLAHDATQESAALSALVNPRGFATSYRFEWGSTEAYGNVAPVDYEPSLGSGEDPVRVEVRLTGLQAASAYHYRVVATSAGGVVATPDQLFETLNACGLPEGRCYELVSRRASGPVAIPGERSSMFEIGFQAATSGPGGLAYQTEFGYPDATKGSESLYRGQRGPDEWKSSQLTGGIFKQNESPSGESTNPGVYWLSDDLTCGLQESFQPLTDDPSAEVAREYGGSNLYRINPDDTRTLVTVKPPENPEVAGGNKNYKIFEGSDDCSKLLFTTQYRYPGVGGTGFERLYEWEGGSLRPAGFVPGPGGEEVAVEATVPDLAAVSGDGSRVFFGAGRQVGLVPGEEGQSGVFVREDGSRTRDISQSETAVPDEGAQFRWATPDGSHVFFTANAGLTAESSPTGTDLYEYSFETGKLTDRSVAANSIPAEVSGFVAATTDGSEAFFATRRQLLPGRGRTLAQNLAQRTYSIYIESQAGLEYVGAFGEKTVGEDVLGGGSATSWIAQVTADGRYLLFESEVNNTSYDSEGRVEAYLYDRDGGPDPVTCISCRQDGKPSVVLNPPGYVTYTPLPGSGIEDYNHQTRYLTMRNGRPSVFFVSTDKLASGAVEEANNVYEWSHGQVFRLTSSTKGLTLRPSPLSGAFPLGASDDGTDAYFGTAESLTWEDSDARRSIYDARVGGGYPEPASAPPPCSSVTEGSCQGPPGTAPQAPSAASETFVGPGTPRGKGHKQRHHRKRKKHRHSHGRRPKAKSHQPGHSHQHGKKDK